MKLSDSSVQELKPMAEGSMPALVRWAISSNLIGSAAILMCCQGTNVLNAHRLKVGGGIKRQVEGEVNVMVVKGERRND